MLCDVDGLKKAIEQHIYSTIQIYRMAEMQGGKR